MSAQPTVAEAMTSLAALSTELWSLQVPSDAEESRTAALGAIVAARAALVDAHGLAAPPAARVARALCAAMTHVVAIANRDAAATAAHPVDAAHAPEATATAPDSRRRPRPSDSGSEPSGDRESHGEAHGDDLFGHHVASLPPSPPAHATTSLGTLSALVAHAAATKAAAVPAASAAVSLASLSVGSLGIAGLSAHQSPVQCFPALAQHQQRARSGTAHAREGVVVKWTSRGGTHQETARFYPCCGVPCDASAPNSGCLLAANAPRHTGAIEQPRQSRTSATRVRHFAIWGCCGRPLVTPGMNGVPFVVSGEHTNGCAAEPTPEGHALNRL
jgi:hypothetical protein